MEGLENTARLGVQDKRVLFQSLLAMIERLLYLNKFPVDMEDFALSLQPPDIEAAWRLLRGKKKLSRSLSPVVSHYFTLHDKKFVLHTYPDEDRGGHIFMSVGGSPDIGNARRHMNVVNQWCVKQIRLEEQVLRSAKVIKAIVHSCNTVGQYKRVSPDLLTFLPDKYRAALKDYMKKSPYPAITVEPQEIDTTLSTLAYAALQPPHWSEEDYIKKPKWNSYSYNLQSFPRTNEYDREDVRKLEL